MSGENIQKLEDLYQEIILDHSRRLVHFGVLRERTHHADGRNPLCGDEIAVSVKIEKGFIEGIRFQGQACAIAKASASIMSGTMEGSTVDEARHCAERFLEVMRPVPCGPEGDTPPEMAALMGVKRFPARVKCATLAWHAFLAALEDRGSVSS